MPQVHAFLDRLTGRQRLSHSEIFFSATGVLVTIGLIALISQKFLSGLALPFIVASMGATAVILFAVPSSPMNRPWALIVGHLSSAVVGVTCAQQIDSLLFAIPVAAAGATLVMRYLRCLHPPGGATAMLIVLGSDQAYAASYQLVLTPIGLNVLILMFASLMIRFITVKIHFHDRQVTVDEWVCELEQGRSLAPQLTRVDLETARAQLDTYIDVEDQALLNLLRLATHNTHHRRLGELCCRDLMLSEPLSAEFGSSLEEVWGWFKHHRLTGVPVINRAHHVIGIITMNDFIRHAEGFPQSTLEQRIHALVKNTTTLTSEKAEVAGQIMTSPVITAQEDTRVSELLPLLDNRHIHHIPIVNAKNKLTGLLNRNEVVAILEGDEVSS